MNDLRITYTDFWPEWSYENFIQPILEKNFNVIIDQKNPDVVFHSIFGRMSQTPKYKAKKILFLGENWRPEQFGSDYSISFDPTSSTNFRLPLWQVYLLIWPGLKDYLFNRDKPEEYKRFAAFIVSNHSNSKRIQAYEELSKYKKVHSYGKVRTNSLELQQLTAGNMWQAAYLEFFRRKPHKFIMAYENTSYPYYCTEKLMNAFLAGGIPLYWGDPKVVEDFNLDAFLNVQKMGGTWVEAVKNLDNDESLFNDMMNQPVFKSHQKNKLEENLNNFESWLIDVIEK
jgi:hypothetical protein